MKTVAVFAFLLLFVGLISGNPPECLAPESEDTEMLMETVAGGPVSFRHALFHSRLQILESNTDTDKKSSFSAPGNRDHKPRFPYSADQTEKKTLLSGDLVRRCHSTDQSKRPSHGLQRNEAPQSQKY